MTFVSRLLATAFFIGYIPVAPGTFGSVLGLLLYFFLPQSESLWFLLIIGLLFFLGVWASGRFENVTGVKDDQVIVIDEVVGTLVTLFAFEKNLPWLVLGFIFFRLFDIWKPPPVRLMEKVPGGWGVMLDDVMAGIYGLLALRLTHAIAGRFL